jgi:hypothetical protein
MSRLLLLALALVASLAVTSCTDDPPPPPPPPASTQQLFFLQQPSSTVAGTPLTDILVRFQTTGGTAVDEPGAAVTLALSSGPPGANFTEVQAPLENGVATFKGITLTRAGSGYAFEARKGSLKRISASFSVSAAPATTLGLATEPGDSTIDGPLGPPVKVLVQDAFGNPRPEATGDVTASLVGGAGTVLSGTTTLALSGGAATFSDLRVETVGEYSLSFSAPGFTSVESRKFLVKPGAPAALTFSAQPSNVTAGEAVAPTITVTLLDRKGNVTPEASANITLSIGSNPGGATLSGALAAATAAGVATFSDVKLNKAAAGYTLRATSGSLQAATSTAFNVSPSTPVRIGFVVQPATATAGEALAPVEVAVQDAFGNTTPSTARIDVALGVNPGNDTLAGTLSLEAVDGVARFTTLSLTKASRGYTLAATTQDLGAATSAAFEVAPAAPAQLRFGVQPADSTAGVALAPFVQVRLLDAFDNQTRSTASVTVELESNPGNGRLSGATTMAAVAGVAFFPNLSVNKAASGYTLRATSGALSATSAAFTISPAGAVAVVFQTQPPSVTAGAPFSPAVEVQVRDAFGNPAAGRVTLSLEDNPGADTLSGTLVVDTVAGVASFSDLSLEKAAAGYTLRAAVSGTPGAVGPRFTVQAAAAHRLAFLREPAVRSVLNAPLGPSTQVRALDAFENLVTTFTGPVSVALGNNPTSATLGGTLTVNASGGVATFLDLKLGTVGTGYTLTASSAGLFSTQSGQFDVVQARLVYTDPGTGRIRLLRNPASTDALLVLDLVAAENLTGYGVGFNLPLDLNRVRFDSMVPGTALPAGSNPVAAKAALPTSGPMQGVLTSGQSQKAAGTGAVPTDTAVPTGAVFYTLRLNLASASPGVVFDGANLGSAFNAAMRDKLGNDVVRRGEFGIGRLEVMSP